MTDIVTRLAKCAAVSEIVGDNPVVLYGAADEIKRLKERLANVSDDNQRIRQSIKEYVQNSTRITNDMLREMWVRDGGEDSTDG